MFLLDATLFTCSYASAPLYTCSDSCNGSYNYHLWVTVDIKTVVDPPLHFYCWYIFFNLGNSPIHSSMILNSHPHSNPGYYCSVPFPNLNFYVFAIRFPFSFCSAFLFLFESHNWLNSSTILHSCLKLMSIYIFNLIEHSYSTANSALYFLNYL